MHYSDSIINAIQAEKILALKLEKALSGVKDEVIKQAKQVNAGVQRLTFYTSCFTDNYQDVCTQLKHEDIRFIKGLIQLIKDRNIIVIMIRIYIELLLKKHDEKKIEKLQRDLIGFNIKISTSYLTKEALIAALATAISLTFNTKGKFKNKISTFSILGLNYYGVIQEAADCANRLKSFNSIYYTALYARNLEMMYFIIEPLIKKTSLAFMTDLSDKDIINIINGMVS